MDRRGCPGIAGRSVLGRGFVGRNVAGRDPTRETVRVAVRPGTAPSVEVVGSR